MFFSKGHLCYQNFFVASVIIKGLGEFPQFEFYLKTHKKSINVCHLKITPGHLTHL